VRVISSIGLVNPYGASAVCGQKKKKSLTSLGSSGKYAKKWVATKPTPNIAAKAMRRLRIARSKDESGDA
jgi:hypothetical protein